MAMTQIRTLGCFVLGALVIAATLVSNDAFAKKNKKGKIKDKDRQEAPAELTPQEKAREHYTKGKELYDLGNYEEALVEFKSAYETKPHPTVLKSIAECQMATADPLGAIETLEKYLADPEASDKGSVEARIEEIKNQPVSVSISSVPEGASISVAGTPIDKVTPTTIELTPGEYVITLTAEGYEPVSKGITVTLGVEKGIAVDFAKEAPPPPAEEKDAIVDPFAEDTTPATLPGSEVEEEKSGPPTAFWVAAAITGVGLVTGTVFGTMALGDEEDYQEDPTPAKKDAGERDAIIADVSFGIAGAAAIAGVVILVTHARKKKKQDAKDAAAVWVTPLASQGELGLNTTVSF